MTDAPRAWLRSAFECAVAAAQPAQAIAQLSFEPPRGRTVVVGAGKAAAGMAAALEARLIALGWPASALPAPSSRVVTRYGHGLSHRGRIAVLEASHPLPDEAGASAGIAMLHAVSELGADDLVIALISGGGSALLCAPYGVTLAQKIALTSELLRCGAEIAEINTVRKHLSLIKGGRLAAATRARVLSLIVSDVVGDDPSSIASGPTAPDATSYAEALAILERYDIRADEARAHLQCGARGELAETPKPGDSLFDRVENRLIVTNMCALEAARSSLERSSFHARTLSDAVTGEARLAAIEHATHARRLPPGHAFVSGGETTVTVRGQGRGGRNLEFLLALAIELGNEAGIYALAADSDGVDGTEHAAGALIAPDTLPRAAKLGLDPQAMLADNDAYTFFAALGDLVVTGPTGTNVNDVRCVLRV